MDKNKQLVLAERSRLRQSLWRSGVAEVGKGSREIGLELAAICGKHFLKLKHLHYGFWTKDLELDITNLHIAQEKYTDFLVSHVPDGVKTILDVGGGLGQTAKRLIDMGYKVDCVSPSPFLNERIRSLLPSASEVFDCTYEQLDAQSKYDMVLFSESFQYVCIEKALQKTVEVLNDGGYLLICDVFKLNISGNGAMGGGHKLAKFSDSLAQYPFEQVEDIDITEQTAPNMDIFDDTVKNVLGPAIDSGLGYLTDKYPLTVKFLRWRYRNKIDRAYRKYFNGGRNGEEFKKFKTYRLFLYRKIPSSLNFGQSG
jgi:SAM-dependent methyltransferase